MNWRAHYLLCAEEAMADAKLSSIRAVLMETDPFLSADSKARFSAKWREFAAEARKRAAKYESYANDIA